MSQKWLIYGAYGYTGRLVAEEALKRGHEPVLAGRDPDKLRVLGDELRLPTIAVSLDDTAALERALEGMALVFHAAGPFSHTSKAMVDACLARGVNYVDVTGEISVFADIFKRDAEARQKHIALIPGVGFDVVPTDCMAAYVASKVPGATELELAIHGMQGISAGTAKSTFEGFLAGGLVRRDGKLVPAPFGKGGRMLRFDHGTRSVMPIPWGDLETAYHTTGIPNITTYMSYPRRMVVGAKAAGPVLQALMPVMRGVLGSGPIKRAIEGALSKVQGPDAQQRERSQTHVWACARDASGREQQAWLRTLDGYAFTAVAGVRIVERILAERPVGALTPALAFGADFVLSIEGTERWDTPPA